MFHSLHVMINDPLVETEQSQEIGQQPMAVGDLASHLFACRSQNKAAILFIFEKSLAIEALHHVGDAGLRNLQRSRDIDDASVTFGVDEFEDTLEVILDSGRTAERRLGDFRGHRFKSKSHVELVNGINNCGLTELYNNTIKLG